MEVCLEPDVARRPRRRREAAAERAFAVGEQDDVRLDLAIPQLHPRPLARLDGHDAAVDDLDAIPQRIEQRRVHRLPRHARNRLRQMECRLAAGLCGQANTLKSQRSKLFEGFAEADATEARLTEGGEAFAADFVAWEPAGLDDCDVAPALRQARRRGDAGRAGSDNDGVAGRHGPVYGVGSPRAR